MPPDRPKIVSFEGKWVEDSLSTRVPGRFAAKGCRLNCADKVAKTALDAFRAIELRDYGRMDIRLSPMARPTSST